MFQDKHLVPLLLGICSAAINIKTTDPPPPRWPSIQPPGTAPGPKAGPVLYALAASQPALSLQTRKHLKTFTRLLLHTSYNASDLLLPRHFPSKLLSQQRDCASCFIDLLHRMDSIDAQRQTSAVLCFAFLFCGRLER